MKNFVDMPPCLALMLGRWSDSPKLHIVVENTEFLNWLSSLRYLCVLSLRGISRIIELPPSIGEIRTLRVLDLQACYDLERLPVEVTQLRNLEHFDTSECYFLTHMPAGMSNLSHLQVLKGFVVGKPKGGEGQSPCKLSEISTLSCIEKLSISIG